jgi:hypothetical protein
MNNKRKMKKKKKRGMRGQISGEINQGSQRREAKT